MSAEQKPSGKWIARYRDEHGKRLSAGTFDTKQDALAAARRAEAAVERGSSSSISGDPGSITLSRYYDIWLKDATQHPKTLSGYTRHFRAHLEPAFGDRPVASIKSPELRRLLKAVAKKHSPHVANQTKAVMGAVYRTLIEEEYVEDSPARGIRISLPDTKPFRPLEKEEFALIVQHLPSEETKFFAKFLISTGMRYGEAAEFRVKDYNRPRREIALTRRATDMSRRDNGSSRILVMPATKGGHNRVIPVSAALDGIMREHIDRHALRSENLVFGKSTMFPPKQKSWEKTVPGETFGSGGRTFRHGTPYAYGDGGCRCPECKAAAAEYARNYKRVNRDPKKFPPMEHMDYHTWKKVWATAAREAGLTWVPRTHDLRHSNATALVQAVDVYEAMQRLGHSNLETTQKYLHRVRESQEKAAQVGDQFL